MEKKLSEITISITNRCNYKCRHCSFDSGNRKVEECSPTEWIEFLREAREFHAKDLDISGGEPALREDLYEIISGAKNLGYKIKLLTNGSLLTDERLQKLKLAGLNGIGISLDGSTSEVYNRLRGMDKRYFEQAIWALRRAKELGFFVKVNSVVCKENLGDMKNLIALVESLKLNEHRICYLSQEGRGKNGEINPAGLGWKKLIEEMRDFGGLDRVYTGLQEISNEQNALCWLREGIFPLQATANGDIYSCAMHSFAGKPIGNIKEKNLARILDNAEPEPCRDYARYSICPLKKFRVGDLITTTKNGAIHYP